MLIPKICNSLEEMQEFLERFGDWAENFFVVEDEESSHRKLVVIVIPDCYRDRVYSIRLGR